MLRLLWISTASRHRHTHTHFKLGTNKTATTWKVPEWAVENIQRACRKVETWEVSKARRTPERRKVSGLLRALGERHPRTVPPAAASGPPAWRGRITVCRPPTNIHCFACCGRLQSSPLKLATPVCSGFQALLDICCAKCLEMRDWCCCQCDSVVGLSLRAWQTVLCIISLIHKGTHYLITLKHFHRKGKILLCV